MSQEERTGHRDLTYSRWHRQQSVKRYLGVERAAKLSMIDIDDVEYCWACKEPLLIIETACANGVKCKTALVSEAVARRSQLPAAIVLYTVDPSGEDIASFHVRRLQPQADKDWEVMNPSQYAEWLWSFREEHDRSCARRRV